MKRPIRVATHWQDTNFWGANAFDFSDTAPPDQTHPMNYLPPIAAGEIAKALGFRLPTYAEWIAAWQINNNTNPNLRDNTWGKQFTNVMRIVKEKGFLGLQTAAYPTNDVFEPLDNRSGKGDDGLLWFGKVTEGSGRPFKNLVGNVAEYVYEPTTKRCFIVGASALSHPDISPTNRFEIEPGDWMAHDQGFSDVGFRLAREAPIPPLDRFQRLLMEMAYLRLDSRSGAQP